jgi:subtilisin
MARSCGARSYRRISGGAFVLLIIAAAAVFSSPAAYARPATGTSSQIVVLADGASVASVTAELSIISTNTYAAAFTGFAADLTPTQISALHSDARVVSITRNRVFHTGLSTRTGSGNDVPQIVTREAKRVGLLNSPTAHVGRNGRPVDATIAILDSGIDPHHPDLNVVGGYNCTNAHHQQWSDDQGHGTIVAGVAAARDNKIDVVGVAPGARLWAIKVLDANLDGTDASVLCGLDWAAAHAELIDVANMSFGGQPDGSLPGQRFDDTTCGRSTGDVLHAAVCRAVALGVVLVAAAGNSSIDAALAIPAAYPEAITASGMVDSDGQPGGFGPPDPCLGLADDTFASFSNFGTPIDIAAPAVCVSSTYPEPDAVAVDSGTSFAAPFVTGAAALLHSRYGHLSPQRVETILKATASPGPLPGDPDSTPEGVLNVAGY